MLIPLRAGKKCKWSAPRAFAAAGSLSPNPNTSITTATTDLDGRCTFGTVPAGDFWVSSLEMEAIAGDAHVRWDVPVRIPAGQNATVQLSSINGIVPGQ